MPKLKTHSGAKILTKKDTKRCRRLRSETYADVTNEATIKKMIPYK